MRRDTCAVTYNAAKRFVEEAMVLDGSVFSPGKEIWTRRILEDFYQAFVLNPDEGSESFLDKFRRQLSEASDETKQLAAELLWFHFLTPTGTGGDKKREIIGEVLSWMENPPAIPGDLSEAMDHGFVQGGFPFTTRRPFQLAFLAEFFRHWKKLADEEVKEALSDPWKFLEVAWSVPVHGGQGQREALLHLIHPDTFEDTISSDALKKIAARYSDLVDDPTAEVHQQVFQIRKRLSDEFGVGFAFFDPNVRVQWSPDNTRWGQLIHWMRLFFEDPKHDEDERDYKLKLAQAIEAAKEKVTGGSSDWFGDLEAALNPSRNTLVPWQMSDTFLKWAQTHQTETSAALTLLWRSAGEVGENIDGFVAALPKEAFKGGIHSRLTLAAFLCMAGDPTSFPPYRYEAFKTSMGLVDFAQLKMESEGTFYRNALAFLDEILTQAESRGLVLRDRLDAQGLVWCVHSSKKKPESWSDQDWNAFLRYRSGDEGGMVDPDGIEAEEPAVASGDLALLADEILFDEGQLQRMIDLLDHKKQVIFMGPPGTGKTFVARKLARFLAGASERVAVVQFHPSYAYEDFMEGYRPRLLENRQPGFEIVAGPLRQIARKAAAEPSQAFVLIIDEINRGNLAKVFGELYYLLEYRKDEIRLQYSDELFSLPENLLIIGTMNTADRSIALVDVALRRRFHFFRFFPDEPPVHGLLKRWLGRNASDFLWLADVLDRANEQLDDRNLAIGPSHFMDQKQLDEPWIRMIWEHSVLPYLEEHFFGQPDRLSEFDLDRLRGVVSDGNFGDSSELAPDSGGEEES